jgi:hypothetical protein
VGSQELPPAARGIPTRVHPAVFKAAHRVAQHHRLGRHRGIPRWHHLPRPGEQTRAQDSHQGERIDGHSHQVCLWSGGRRSHLPEGQAASGKTEGRRPEAFAQRGTKNKARKKAQAKCDAVDADLVAAAEHRNPRKPPGGANAFDKMLKKSCPSLVEKSSNPAAPINYHWRFQLPRASKKTRWAQLGNRQWK